jgi:hypothetical protein
MYVWTAACRRRGARNVGCLFSTRTPPFISLHHLFALITLIPLISHIVLHSPQCGQMGLWKSRPKRGPTTFLSKLIHNWEWDRGKNSPKKCATAVIFKPLPKVKNRPIYEKSPNLVTSIPSSISSRTQSFGDILGETKVFGKFSESCSGDTQSYDRELQRHG